MEEEQVAKATGRLILLSVELSYYFDFSRWVVELHLPAIQFNAESGIILTRRFERQALASTDSGLQLNLGDRAKRLSQ